MATIEAQIRIRRDTAANFTTANPTLALGEIAYETDTRNIKVGDGATAWTVLSYINPFRGNPNADTTNTVLGSGAGNSIQAGSQYNTFIGSPAGPTRTNGTSNTVVGAFAFTQNGGNENTAVGTAAMNAGTGNNNVALGRDAAAASGSFSSVVAVGHSAAKLNTASDITAVGANALDANTTGVRLVAVGKDALGANTASDNTAVGHAALAANQAGSGNTAVGSRALDALVTNTTDNTAVGANALGALTDGSTNVAVGAGAASSLNVSGAPQNGATAVGGYALLSATSAGSTTAIGTSAGRFVASGATCTSATNSVFIGANSRAADNGQDNQVVIAGSVGGVGGIGNGSNTTTIGNSSTTGTFIPAGNLTLTNGNFIVGTSGKGIDFSATANSSGTMTSELLSDYEEGTFTPTVSSGVTTPTYTTQAGRYTKIGRMVYFTIRLHLSGGTTNASALTFAGLPFTSSSDSAHRPGGAYLVYNNSFLATNTDQLPQFLVPVTNTTVEVWQNNGSAFAGTSWNNSTGVFVWNGSYFT